MTSPRESANMNAGRHRPPPPVEFEIDVSRVVWDQEYRREVMAELRRRSHLDPVTPGRARKRPKDGPRRKAS
jgi:hypothetical protein